MEVQQVTCHWCPAVEEQVWRVRRGGRDSSLGLTGGLMLDLGWASLVAQTLKTLPATQETRFNPRVGKTPLKKGMATHSSILAGESHGQRSWAGYTPWGCRVRHE